MRRILAFSNLFALGSIATLFFFTECRADYVVLGGSGQIGEGSDAPIFPLADAFSIGQSSAAPIAMPQNFQGSIGNVAIDSYRGTVLFVGQDGNNFPFIFRGSVVSSEVTVISLPSNIGTGAFVSAVFDSDGNAIIGGWGQDPSPAVPLVYKLPLGSAEAIPVALPNNDEGKINNVAMAPNNIAILAGQDNTTGNPLIYAFSSGANQATPVSLPDGSVQGYINSIAVGPNGTAILGGQDTTAGSGNSLIYSLAPGSSSASAISVPNTDDGSVVNDVAIGPDNTAILGGSIGLFPTSPLIYRILPEGSSAQIIQNADLDDGSINGVAIGSDGIAILGGRDDTTELPLIYRVGAGSNRATAIQLPNANLGEIISVVIGSQNVAVLGGDYINSNQLLVFTVSTTDSAASSIATSQQLENETIISVAIYDYDGLYDIRRLRPYYYLQLSETKTELNQAGLL